MKLNLMLSSLLIAGAYGQGDWSFCSTNSQCNNRCCSKQYSNDGRYKCTPGGSQNQCTGDPSATAPPVSSTGPQNYIGVNSFFIHALNPGKRNEAINYLSQAGVKFVRIFISSLGRINCNSRPCTYTPAPGYKGADAREVHDLEMNNIGQYNDTVLRLIDEMLPRLEAAGMKVVIAMHDRHHLGVWGLDGYARNLGYTLTCPSSSSCSDAQGNRDGFYNNANTIQQFDNRIARILNYQSTSYPGRRFGDLTHVIHSFNIQNEAQGGLTTQHDNWLCNRATAAKRHNPTVPISTGGAKTFERSMIIQNFQCAAIDHIGLHTYDGQDQYDRNIAEAARRARQYGKKLIFEEYGTQNSDKSQILRFATDVANRYGIPSAIWQVLPSNKGDFEFYADEGNNWNALRNAAASARNFRSELVPEFNTAAPPTTTTTTTNTCTETCPSELAQGTCKFFTQGDANLVVYSNGNAVWSSGTNGRGVGPYRTVVQGDGNVVAYDKNNAVIYATGTNGRGVGPYRLVMQDDCNLVLYDKNNQALWATNTSG